MKISQQSWNAIKKYFGPNRLGENENEFFENL